MMRSNFLPSATKKLKKMNFSHPSNRYIYRKNTTVHNIQRSTIKNLNLCPVEQLQFDEDGQIKIAPCPIIENFVCHSHHVS